MQAQPDGKGLASCAQIGNEDTQISNLSISTQNTSDERGEFSSGVEEPKTHWLSLATEFVLRALQLIYSNSMSQDCPAVDIVWWQSLLMFHKQKTYR